MMFEFLNECCQRQPITNFASIKQEAFDDFLEMIAISAAPIKTKRNMTTENSGTCGEEVGELLGWFVLQGPVLVEDWEFDDCGGLQLAVANGVGAGLEAGAGVLVGVAVGYNT